MISRCRKAFGRVAKFFRRFRSVANKLDRPETTISNTSTNTTVSIKPKPTQVPVKDPHEECKLNTELGPETIRPIVVSNYLVTIGAGHYSNCPCQIRVPHQFRYIRDHLADIVANLKVHDTSAFSEHPVWHNDQDYKECAVMLNKARVHGASITSLLATPRGRFLVYSAYEQHVLPLKVNVRNMLNMGATNAEIADVLKRQNNAFDGIFDRVLDNARLVRNLKRDCIAAISMSVIRGAPKDVALIIADYTTILEIGTGEQIHILRAKIESECIARKNLMDSRKEYLDMLERCNDSFSSEFETQTDIYVAEYDEQIKVLSQELTDLLHK